MRNDGNPDAVIKTVKFKTLLKIAELRINPELECPFSEARQPPVFTWGESRMTKQHF